MADENQIPEIKLDADNLYREEIITDGRAGSIRKLVPVKSDGTDDDGRAILYQGQTNIMTPGGTLPISFRIDADSLEDAMDQFPKLAKQSIEETFEELQKLRRESASGLVVPGRDGGPAGAQGGGKIQLS